MPAPPLLSEPAMVSATGMVCFCERNVLFINRISRNIDIELSSLRFIFLVMDKDKVADLLVEIGVLLELKGENPFKTRAYTNAARALENLSEPLEKLVAENRLGEIKGIGEGIQKKINDLVTTGKLAYYDELKASVPPGLMEMLQIPGL